MLKNVKKYYNIILFNVYLHKQKKLKKKSQTHCNNLKKITRNLYIQLINQ